jgi:hypothetical protein
MKMNSKRKTKGIAKGQLQELYKALKDVDHSRQKRKTMAQQVVQHPTWIGPLLEIAQKEEDPISYRASWILEFSIREDLSLLYPYLDLFVAGLPKITLEPSVRPMAKMCEMLAISYFKQKHNATRSVVQKAHLKDMATVCFDWLIGPYKVAPKAYSMTSLFHLGTQIPWIHEELKCLLQQQYASGTPAYRARAGLILKRLST